MQEKKEQTIASHSAHKKITDQLCGRLILWDVGTPHEDIVVFAAEYCHTKYDLSPQIEVKPYVPVVGDLRSLSKVSSIKKVAKHFNERFNATSRRGAFLKKTLLH